MTTETKSLVPVWAIATDAVSVSDVLGEEGMTPARLAELRTVLAALANSPVVTLEVLRGFVYSILAAVALPGLLLVVLYIVASVVHSRDVRRRDPVRRFGRQQRREGMTRAGGQCEMESRLGRRCPQPAEHGDHFFPWSKGALYKPAKLRRRLCQMQPDQRREDTLARSAGEDPSPTAGVPGVGRSHQRRRTAAVSLSGMDRANNWPRLNA